MLRVIAELFTQDSQSPFKDGLQGLALREGIQRVVDHHTHFTDRVAEISVRIDDLPTIIVRQDIVMMKISVQQDILRAIRRHFCKESFRFGK
ncbi:hypothetical protein D3C72_1894290 [compost metagenome]